MSTIKFKTNIKGFKALRNGPEAIALAKRAGEAGAAAAGEIARLPEPEEGRARGRQAVILGGTQDEQQEALGKVIGAAGGALR